MKCIVLFGAGKSSSVLIDYLKIISRQYNWQVFVADAHLASASEKTGDHAFVTPVEINVYDDEQRASLIKKSDVVISLLPPSFHILVAKDCVQYGKHLLTASYIDAHIKLLENDIKEKGLLFLCETGLDPGIDHMSAMQIIHRIQNEGGSVTSFMSHCGGLVAPESDTNPWHYKVSWNPRNIVMAGKAGAVYKKNGKRETVAYEDMFINNQMVKIPDLGQYAWYPNRDSPSYETLYGLEEAHTFIRTTLRHPDFCLGWQYIINLKLTDETIWYDTNGLSIAGFFKEHIAKHGFDISRLNENKTAFNQFLFLGLHDDTLISKGTCSAADILQFILEQKLSLQPDDKDMIVMLHEIEYTINNEAKKQNSYVMIKGENGKKTAMAKTVGLPLGIAAQLLLNNKINETGLHIPILPSLYNPILKQLAEHDIVFSEF